MANSKQARAGNRSGRGSAAKAKDGGSAANAGGAVRRGPNRGGSGGNGGSTGQRSAAKPAQSRPAAKPAQTRKARDRARAKELAQEKATAEPAAVGPPLWLQLATLALAVGGLGVSIYLTIAHFTTTAILACSSNSVVNCDAVTTSPQSLLFGLHQLPVAVLGLAFYLFMVAVTTPMAWRSPRREIALARLGSVIVGVGFILYLIYAELFQVRFICLWCTSVHVITFLLFVLVALAAAVWGSSQETNSRRKGRY
jgi:uncharacterized membrane protein